MSQKTLKLLKELKDELQTLENEATSAINRRQIAQNVADNLENRNKDALMELKEVEVKLQEINSQLPKLEKAKENLQEDIRSINLQIPLLKNEIGQLSDSRMVVQSEIEDNTRELDSVMEDISDKSSKLAGLNINCDESKKEISELEESKGALFNSISILQEEADKLEDFIIEQDAVFKDNESKNKQQLEEIQSHLTVSRNKLLESEKKDKAIRESWAEGTLKLEKREKIIRKRELLLEENDSRLRQQDDFMRI